MCSSLQTLHVCRWYTQPVCGLFGSEACRVSSRFGSPPTAYASLPEVSVWWEGSLQSAPHGAGPTTAEVAVRSDGGIGDECVSISVLTHQIVKLLPEIGSPCCGYLPSGRWLGTSHIFLWGDWCRKRRWCSLSFIPIWRACGCGHSCHGQIKYYLASRVSRWTAKRQAGRTLSAVLKHHLHIRACHFSPDLHTEVSRSWAKPFSARLFVPSSNYYGNVTRTSERGYRAVPLVEQMLAICPLTLRCLWRLRLCPPNHCTTFSTGGQGVRGSRSGWFVSARGGAAGVPGWPAHRARGWRGI